MIAHYATKDSVLEQMAINDFIITKELPLIKIDDFAGKLFLSSRSRFIRGSLSADWRNANFW